MTHVIPNAEQHLLDYESWTERVRSLCGLYDPRGVDPKAFSGWILPHKICSFGAANIGWNAERVERTQRDARRDGMDHFYVVFQLSGSSVICCDDRVDKLCAGDFALVDAARAVRHFRAARADGRPGWRISMHLPREPLIRYLGSEPSVGMRTQSESLAGRLFFQLVRDVATHTDADPSQSGPHMQLMIYDLLSALFLEPETFSHSQHSEKLFRRITAMAHSCFADPDIGPSEIAAESGISVRSLQKLFAARGTTCGQYIQSLRLSCAMRLLQRRALLQTGQPLSEIAYASGFRDYRHFARAFNERFGYAPGRIGRTDRKERDEIHDLAQSGFTRLARSSAASHS
jgi:AraC-like DNA-binding protein